MYVLFEGIDGVGKSTQIEILASKFSDVIVTKEPGGTQLGENLREILASTTKSLDIVKYCLPECYKTELTWSINARSLQNFISLRSSKSALWEIRNLANAIYDALPNEHKFIFEKCLPEDEG